MADASLVIGEGVLALNSLATRQTNNVVHFVTPQLERALLKSVGRQRGNE